MITLGPGIEVGAGVKIGQFPVQTTFVYFIDEVEPGGLPVYLTAENGYSFVEEY